MTDKNLKQSVVHQVFLAMLLGMIVGSLAGQAADILGLLGKLVIQVIKAVAIPLVFVAIMEALVVQFISLSEVGRLFKIVSINAICAAFIGLSLANLLKPGDWISFGANAQVDSGSVAKLKPIEISSVLQGYIPDSIIKPFVDNSMIPVILIAVLFGLATRRVAQRSTQTQRSAIESGLKLILSVVEQAISWLVKLVPIAVFGVTAKTVGDYGFAPFVGLIGYLAVVVVGLGLQVTIVYMTWVWLVRGIPLKVFWQAAIRPITYAFGTNSSLATLPVTLQALDQLKVPKSCSRLGACVGTNLNNDGILLYEAVAALVVAQMHGIDLSVAQQLAVVGLSVVAAIGVAGVPEAGFISLTLVLTTVGLPLESLALLLTVDWLIARLRSVTNVLSDMTVSIAINSAKAASTT